MIDAVNFHKSVVDVKNMCKDFCFLIVEKDYEKNCYRGRVMFKSKRDLEDFKRLFPEASDFEERFSEDTWARKGIELDDVQYYIAEALLDEKTDD